MADKKTGNIFQQLSQVFGRGDGASTNIRVNKYKSSGTILKTTSKKEYESAKLLAQQDQYLQNQWNRVDGELFQQALYYETTRVGSYSDFESMEFYPEIAAALDIYMEESTTPDSNGEILHVYSSSSRVKAILEDLYKNRLQIHTSLPMWTRNLAKYGDNFVYLNINSKEGVVAARQLPNFEIERRDFNLQGIINARSTTPADTKNNKTTFYWKGKDLEYNSWQIAHFRLLGDDRKLPYGTSILEKSRRIWKQLILSEDAMLVYRVTRAPERRVYKVYVGNINPDDVQAYVNDIANRFKRKPLIDPKTGQMDMRYNQLGYDQDIFVPVRTEGADTPIDTLPGAQNLDQIADIEYLQKKLFAALRTPKAFLGFEEATGEGKNLALQDIRFSRTVNRVQQALLMELNKIGIIHLYLLGFKEDLQNFTLSLNNPSTQAEMLKIEHLREKVGLYKDCVSDSGNGFATMSMSRAKKEILGWSDDEIKADLVQQRIEKAAASELENTPNVIKHTGTFDVADRIYGDMEMAKKGGQIEDGDGVPGGPGGPGGGGPGGGGFGGGFDDMDFDLDDNEDQGGDSVDMGGGGPDDIDLNFDDMDVPEATDETTLRNNKKSLNEAKMLGTYKQDITLAPKTYELKGKLTSSNLNEMVSQIDKMINDDKNKKTKL